MTEKILVAFDGGPASSAALAWAVDRSLSTAVHLEIMAVAETAGLPTGLVGSISEHYEELLKETKGTVLRSSPKTVVITTVVRGNPQQRLIEASARKDLVVVGTKKTSPLVGIAHGTLPLKVAGQAECTTVVVPADWHPTGGEVVVGWSNDATSDAALDFAVAEANRTGRALTIVHTWGAVVPPELVGGTIVVQELAAAEKRLLADAADRVRGDYPSLAITQVLQIDSAAVAIVRAADEASLVVVGSRGRGAVAGFFLGSVSHDVLLNMPAPVAVVPQTVEPIEVCPELVEEEA